MQIDINACLCDKSWNIESTTTAAKMVRLKREGCSVPFSASLLLIDQQPAIGHQVCVRSQPSGREQSFKEQKDTKEKRPTRRLLSCPKNQVQDYLSLVVVARHTNRWSISRIDPIFARINRSIWPKRSTRKRENETKWLLYCHCKWQLPVNLRFLSRSWCSAAIS